MVVVYSEAGGRGDGARAKWLRPSRSLRWEQGVGNTVAASYPSAAKRRWRRFAGREPWRIWKERIQSLLYPLSDERWSKRLKALVGHMMEGQMFLQYSEWSVRQNAAFSTIFSHSREHSHSCLRHQLSEHITHHTSHITPLISSVSSSNSSLTSLIHSSI
jgi:hypothetical protein